MKHTQTDRSELLALTQLATFKVSRVQIEPNTSHTFFRFIALLFLCSQSFQPFSSYKYFRNKKSIILNTYTQKHPEPNINMEMSLMYMFEYILRAMIKLACQVIIEMCQDRDSDLGVGCVT